MTDRRASALRPGACGITTSEEFCTYSGLPGDSASGALRTRSRGWRSYGCRTNVIPAAPPGCISAHATMPDCAATMAVRMRQRPHPWPQ